MFFIQMSGVPGSGKSTLAREIAKRTGCIIVDHDIVKTALLNSMEEINMDGKLAGKISYNIDFSLVDFHLSLGQNVILDSPCLYDEMIEKGTKLSAKYNANYKYIECYLEDFTEINHRLKSRQKMLSQITEFQSETNFYTTLQGSKKPLVNGSIVVNTANILESYIEDVMRYVITD
ncbi:ATP-binding protein [Lysinibacillus sp. 2017]|uniref:AAA family ATPase n=1 Tax=unclassified Lysinibacillus TaxID=2636778 RepID=UPI000D529078|nr:MULTISPECIES: AAA family ATPase [unclassified Lysinibacillus]AWE07145.1 ATP-binding protein [Lysinibacillus sp. 2017]TGN37430.1 ATP-binding protein [Lysinibacillus sp. S2017]